MAGQKQELASQAVQSVPSVTAATATVILGITVNELLAWVSIVFIVLQAAYLIWKWVRELRRS